MKVQISPCIAALALGAVFPLTSSTPATAAPLTLNELPVSPRARLNFEIVDGKTKQPVSATAPGTTSEENGVSVKSAFKRDDAYGRGVWSVQLRNTGAAQRWLTLRWRAHANIDGAPTYWGGRGPTWQGTNLTKLMPTDAGFDTLPLQTVSSGDEGLAMGLEPDAIFSDFYQSIEIDATTGKPALVLTIPLVLDAGQSDSINVELYPFVPRYSYFDAVQKYFDAHPAAFNPRSDIDPRTTGGGATYVTWGQNEPELARRFLGDWEWVYAAFKRTGDIYGRPEFWNYTPARPFAKNWVDKTPAQYHAERKAQLERGQRADTAMMFYTPSFIFCEEQLAKQQYPGAIVYKNDGSYAWWSGKPWVTGHDNEVMVYPWANKFSEQSQRDIKQLLDDGLNIQGFGYDVLNGGYRHRGEGMNESPRRAFDENGVYVDVSVGIAKMMDFTRSLERNGRKMALVSNPTGPCRTFLVARSDAGMFEYPPYKQVQQLQNLRLLMGHKPLCWWDDWGISDMIDWQHMSGADVKDAYRGARDYTLLASFRYGGLPTPRMAMGTPKLVKWLGLLREVIRAGWQPVTAVRSIPETVWPARYGSGLGSYITLGNAAREAYKGTITIDNDYIGPDNYIFAAHDGRPIKQTVKDRITQIEVEIPAHEPLILRAIGVAGTKNTGTLTLSWKIDDNGTLGVLNQKGPLNPTVTLSPNDDYRLDTFKTRDRPLRSKYFGTSKKTLLNFPFFTETSTATIVLPEKPSAAEEWAAMRVQEYFRFWGKRGLKPARSIELPIVRGEAPNGVPAIRIGDKSMRPIARGKAPAGVPGFRIANNAPLIGSKPIMVLGNNLYLYRRPAHEKQQPPMHDIVLKLLEALDEKYFYPGEFATAGEAAVGEPQALKKADIAGGVLD